MVTTDIDILHRYGHGYSVLAVAGDVYVAGGLQDERNNIGIPYPDSGFHKYDPDTNKWFTLPSMPVPDCYPLLVEMDGCIYAIGSSSQRFDSTHARRYHIATKRWESIKPINLDLNDISGVACNGYLLVAGSNLVNERNAFGDHADGLYDQNLYVFVFAYDPINNQWTKVYQSYIPPFGVRALIPSLNHRQHPVQIFCYDGSYYFQSVRYAMGYQYVKVEEVIFDSTNPESLLFMLGEEVERRYQELPIMHCFLWECLHGMLSFVFSDEIILN